MSSQAVSGPGGKTTTNYGYNADGDLTTTTGAQSQSLTWDDAGRLSQLSGSAGTTGYIYDADGNLLIRQDPGSTTLYMPDEEITLAGSALSGTRYYTVGGVTVAARSSSGQIDYLAGDQQGTSTLAVNANTMAVTSRFYDPYGNTVGPPATGWPGQQGFQNGAADTTTSLTDIGAREYDSGTGSFISPDPLLGPTDPQDLNPYAYAEDAPPTGEDPTGQYASYGSGGDSYVGTGQSYQNTHGDPTPAPGRAPSGTSDNFVFVSPNVVIEKNDPYYTTMVNALDNLLETNSAYGKALSTGDLYTQEWVWNAACHTAGTSACNPLFMAQVAPGGDTAPNPANGILVIGAHIGKGGFAVGFSASSVGTSSGPEADTCGGMSFTGTTKVLAASGIAVPIENLKVGDMVLSTNIHSGKTEPESVTAVQLHHDTDLYDLRVRAHGKTGVIDTTSNHLFWDPDLRRWIPSVRLKRGEHLKTVDGATATVLGGAVPPDSSGWMWDLTVPGDNVHDFYVVAGSGKSGTATILVHNSSCSVSNDTLTHIERNHTPGGDLNGTDKSAWTVDPEEMITAVDYVLGQDPEGVPNTDGRDGTIHRASMPDEIGDGGYIGVSSVEAGRFPIDEVEVILNPDGSLRNAYPAADTPDMVDGW